MKTNMHFGATAAVFRRARELRSKLTPAEKLLWQYRRENQAGYKIRQQHPMMWYVVDFYCHASRLVIEIDGHIHSLKDVSENDSEKEQNLVDQGLAIIRFTNQEVLTNPLYVVETIKNKINELRAKRISEHPDLYTELCD